MQQQKELTRGDLLRPDGCLAQAGYATELVCRYDRAAIRAGQLRIKEWDYYCVMDGTTALALTIADNAYMGLDSVTLIDLAAGQEQTRTFMRLLPMGKTALPSTSETGDVAVTRPGYHIAFENRDGKRTLRVHVERFDGALPLDATITLQAPPPHSMVIATPFAGKPRHFYYNQKINCLRASGTVTVGERAHTFAPDTAAAVLDWGRGVWTYKNTWYWSSLNSYLDGVPFGFNLGYGFGDTSAASENMLFYNGRAHKLEQVAFQIPQTDGGRDDFLKPWTITDRQERLHLTFEPTLDRASCTNLGVLKSDQHQVFGVFSGAATLDDGTVLALHRLPGFAEKVTNLW